MRGQIVAQIVACHIVILQVAAGKEFFSQYRMFFPPDRTIFFAGFDTGQLCLLTGRRKLSTVAGQDGMKISQCDEKIRDLSSQSDCGLSAKALKISCWKVRFQGVGKAVTREIFFEKLIGCFSRHERNLYDQPEFVLCDLKRYSQTFELQVRAKTKQSVLARLARLKISCKQIRCRLFDPTGVPSFSGWLVNQYGLDSSDPSIPQCPRPNIDSVYQR